MSLEGKASQNRAGFFLCQSSLRWPVRISRSIPVISGRVCPREQWEIYAGQSPGPKPSASPPAAGPAAVRVSRVPAADEASMTFSLESIRFARAKSKAIVSMEERRTY